jgi:hypothetical protein
LTGFELRPFLGCLELEDEGNVEPGSLGELGNAGAIETDSIGIKRNES